MKAFSASASIFIAFAFAALSGCVSIDVSPLLEKRLLKNDASPAARTFAQSLCFDGKAYIYGGIGLDGALASPAFFDFQKQRWELLAEPHARDAPRLWHSLVSSGTEIIVWGGRDLNRRYFDSGYAYNPESGRWRSLSMAGAPPARLGHNAIWHQGWMYIFGGFDGQRYFKDLHAYHAQNDLWERIDLKFPDGFAARSDAAATVIEGKLYVIGGRGEAGGLSDGFVVDLEQAQQRRQQIVTMIHLPKSSSGRWKALLVPWQEKVLLFGGQTERAREGRSLLAFDPNTKTWDDIAVSKLPRPESSFQALWDGERFWAFGSKAPNNVSEPLFFSYRPLDVEAVHHILPSAFATRFGPISQICDEHWLIWSGYHNAQSGDPPELQEDGLIIDLSSPPRLLGGTKE